MSYYPKEAVYTEFINDGVNELPSMSTREKTTVFVKDVSEGSSSSFKSNEPSEVLRMSIPVGSVALKVGVRFNLVKKEISTSPE